MTEPRTRDYGEIVGGSRYPHWLRFRNADGTDWDVSTVYEPDSFRAAIRRHGNLTADPLAEFAVDESDVANGNVLLTLTAEQTRTMQGQITEGLMEVQAVVAGGSDPDTLFLLDVTVLGDAAR